MKRAIKSCSVLIVGLFVSVWDSGMPVVNAGEPGIDGAELNGDVNCSGTRDMSDAVLLLNWLFLGGNRPCPIADPPELLERITELEASVGDRDAEIARLQAELEATQANLIATQGDLNDAQAALVEAQGQLKECSAGLNGTNRELDECTEALAASERRVAELEVPGCTDPSADNHSLTANVDDGSCEYLGCTDSGAHNFDPWANVDDGSCCYTDLSCREVPGFTYLGENSKGKSEYEHDRLREEFGARMIFVRLDPPAGQQHLQYFMGGRFSEEQPQHLVTLTPFLIAKFEVTQEQYESVMHGHAMLSANPSRYEGEDLPVEHVSWNDLKDSDGFLVRTGLSLPSEAQWEFACRAGTNTAFSFGSDCDARDCDCCVPALSHLWWCANSGVTTHKVGQMEPNPFGLHDMHGNVLEWCEDSWSSQFYGSEAATELDPVFRDDSGDRVYRGGSFRHSPAECRSAWRGSQPGDYRHDNRGFRPVKRLGNP